MARKINIFYVWEMKCSTSDKRHRIKASRGHAIFKKTRYRTSVIVRSYFLFPKRRILLAFTLVCTYEGTLGVRDIRMRALSSSAILYGGRVKAGVIRKIAHAGRKEKGKKKKKGKKKRNGAFRRSASCNREVGGWALNDGTHAMPS